MHQVLPARELCDLWILPNSVNALELGLGIQGFVKIQFPL